MIGRTVSHYRILEAIGEGGMGVVYLAEDTTLQRHVALKFPSQRAFDRSDQLARFVHEARAAAALDHPNICTIYEIAEDDGRMFIAMGFVEGVTVRQLVAEGPLPMEKALSIAAQTAEGLRAAHEKDIIHRDIKSANIMVTGHGQVKIMDFGLAKLPDQTKLTKTGTTVGTISYMSPEQARGDRIDERADLFSLGVVLYEMLTGALPFPGDHEAAVVYSILNREPKPLADHGVDCPEAVQRVVDKALQKDPDDRFQTANEMLLALNDAREGSAPGVPERRAKTGRFVRVGGVALAIALLLAIGSMLMDRSVPQDDGGAPATALALEPFVVAVAPFRGHTAQAAEDGKLMQAMVARRIDDVIGGEESVRLVADETMEAPRFHSDARAMGNQLNATIVIWGEVLELRGEVEIQPYVTVIKPITRLRDRSVDALEVDLSQPEQLNLRKAKAAETGNMALLVAGAYYRKRDADRALSLLAQIEPPTAESLRQEGNIHFDRGEYQRAEQMYQKAIALSPDDPAPYLNLSHCYFAQRLRDEAVTAAEKALALDPTDPGAIRNLGYCYVRVKRYDEGIAKFNEAIEIEPADAASHDGLGWAYHQQKRWEEAESEYKKAIELDPDCASPHNNLGWAYYQQKRVEDALAEYQTAIDIDSTLAWPYNNLGWHYLQSGDPARSVPLFEKAIVLDAAIVKPRVNLMFANYRLGRSDEALAAAKELLAVDSTSVNAYTIMAAIYSGQGEHEEAVVSMERAVAFRPQSATIRTNLAKSYGAAGRWEEAIASHQAAIELAPARPDLRFDLGTAYQQTGEYGKAAEAFKQALEISDADPYFHVYYYLNLLRIGDEEKAREYIRSVAGRFEMDEVIAKMIQFYACKITEDSVLAAATAEEPNQDRERKCEAYYYLGMAYTIGAEPARRDPGIARDYFEKCRGTGVEAFTEYQLAGGELDLLED